MKRAKQRYDVHGKDLRRIGQARGVGEQYDDYIKSLNFMTWTSSLSLEDMGIIFITLFNLPPRPHPY